MIELISGIVIGGVAGVALKDKIVGNSSQNDTKQRELETLYAENEKFRQRNKEAERQVEDLMVELDRIRKKAKENDELARKVKEYKDACEAQAAQISLLKEKIG